jgi:hypothetical protein
VVTMKKAVFWDVAMLVLAHAGSYLADFLLFSSTLKIEAISSSETSVNTISTWRHIPENCFLQDILFPQLCLTISDTLI